MVLITRVKFVTTREYLIYFRDWNAITALNIVTIVNKLETHGSPNELSFTLIHFLNV